jgi:hypothetical protein
MIVQLISLFVLALSVTSQTLTITPLNTTINSNTTYNINIVRLTATTNWSSATTLTIVFPSDSYTTTQLNNVSCVPTCTVNGLTIIITKGNISSTSPSSISIVVKNIINPPTTLAPSAVVYRLLSLANVTMEMSSFFMGSFTATN